ncbi:hypothetical protein CC78DRAFT_527867 [Lojkania enalia]|uniref:Uncharacterized protein n=1 Tax=Lojkania enalia TaxID=147567 RepID=A0A9P4ND41_9PLEO|nr:hypothetical protein CC78DRAFT_527867 [Didymosphaeria enalia]
MVLKEPPLQVRCTFYEHTSTRTEQIDCGGCIPKTLLLGVGLVSLPASKYGVAVG